MRGDPLAGHHFRIGDREVAYLLRRSPRRRTIGLKVDPSGLTVSVPSRLTRREWEAVLVEKGAWVLDKLEEMRARSVPPFLWEDGQRLPFLGGSIELVAEHGPGRGRPALAEGMLRVPLANPGNATDLAAKVVKWYRNEALTLFSHRVAFYARQLDVSVSRLGLSNARTRWGSCTSQGAIRLNWRLVKAPPPVIDYVVIHELAHRIELNHSSAFWETVAQACPDYREQRAFLKLHSGLYHQF